MIEIGENLLAAVAIITMGAMFIVCMVAVVRILKL